jgi:hypothetical protein
MTPPVFAPRRKRRRGCFITGGSPTKGGDTIKKGLSPADFYCAGYNDFLYRRLSMGF